MLAIVAREYGGPEVLRPEQVPEPEAGPGEVLVRIAAAGLNPVDAEFVAAPAAELAPKPTGLDHVGAAALPLCGLTALQTLDAAGLGPRMRVLVHGAAGGVGQLAVQLAVARGASVIAACRGRHHDRLRSLGTGELVDPDGVEVADAVEPVDVAIDCVGDDALVAAVREGGVVARVPGAAGGPDGLERAASARGVRVVRHVVHPDRAGLVVLSDLVAAGRLDVEIDQVLPLADAQEAHRLLARRTSRGKIVLVV